MKTLKIFFMILVYTIITYSQNNSPNLIWSIDEISDKQTGYDYQSWGSAQQVWLDLNNQGYLHAIFIYSGVADGAWADRTSLYFGSTDAGESWFEVGAVPVNNGTTGRSGFPSIVGTSDGSAVISNHNSSATHTTRSTIFIDSSPFANNFSEYDPGTTPFGQGEAIWPKLAINANDDIVILSSINNGDSFYVNTLQSGTFSGWQTFNGEQAQTHSANFSNGGKVGLAWIGGIGQDGNVYYMESTNNGLTWSAPLQIFTAIPDPTLPTDIYGSYKGIDVNFCGEEPVVVFEVGWQTASGLYYPTRESDIRFWSPTINGGIPKVIADSNNVPFYRNYGIFDFQYPLSRPVIGRSQSNDFLFVAFNATTGEYWPGISSADSTAFMCGMFMYSSDAGNTWSTPERFTPITSPLIDWRYVSIVPVSPVNNNSITVHLVMQGDPMPGSNVNSWGQLLSVSAQYYHFSNEVVIADDVEDEQEIISSFNLEQNYPNPFNPVTSIKYVVGSLSYVTLKVYDVLGNEIATLVNEELSAGEYEVTFDSHSGEVRNLTSGIYFYTLRAGSFVQTMKMILLK